ncbi:MAG: PQQ-binding-like beta-propeller repeat protein [Chloroflexota bacterium]
MRARPAGAMALLVTASLALTSAVAAQSPQPIPSAGPSALPSPLPSSSPGGGGGGGGGPTAAPTASLAARTPRATDSGGTVSGASASPAASNGPEATLSPAERRMPPEVRGAEDQWPLPNQDYAGRRRVPSSPIDASTVDRLGVAWTAAIPDQSEYGYGAFATNPLVIDGRVYIQDLTSDIHVYDLQTGDVIWQTPDWNQPQLGPNGVAVGYGRVYAVRGASTIVALDAKDGTEIWSKDLQVQNKTEGVTIQPIVYDDRVYVSTVPGTGPDFYSGGVSGILTALDARTGDVVWRFDTDASGNLWGNRKVNSGGGAWYPPTIDTRTRETFWGIGNPAPYPGTADFPAGSSRPGKNAYTDSVVALKPDGTLDWFRQLRAHDLFDLDAQMPPILATLSIEGKDQPIVIGSGKLGVVAAMERDTGKVLWRTPVGRHENDDVTDIPADGITVYPGTLGGVETPMAYADGVVYAAYLDVSTTYTPSAVTDIGLKDDNGGVVAIDAATGKVIWDTKEDSMVLGAVTVVNDLVLTATYDGRIIFLDRTTGAQVWSQQAPAGINGWPAVVGDTVLVPAGVGATPMLIALRLDATDQMPSPAPSPSASPSAAASPGASLSPSASPMGPAGPASPNPELPAPSSSPAASGGPVGSAMPSVAPVASGSPAASGSATVIQESTSDAAPLSFDQTTLQAPAGTQVTVEYKNGVAVPHNISFYAGADATAELIAGTKVQTGPVTETVTFTTPTQPGSYFFRCDVHPDTMRGTLVVS